MLPWALGRGLFSLFLGTKQILLGHLLGPRDTRKQTSHEMTQEAATHVLEAEGLLHLT